MSRNKILAVIPTAMILLTPTQGWADRFTFRGRDIVLEAPQGYCALDSHRPRELRMIQQRQTMLSVYGEIAMVYADCRELEQFRRGDPVRLDDIGSISIGKENAKIVPVYGISRRQFVDDTLKSIAEADLRNFQEVADTGARKASAANSIDVTPIHVLGHDDTAVYVGGSLRVTKTDGVTDLRDSVDAATLINALEVEIGISRPSVEGGLELMLATQHDNVAALIRANASNDSTPATPHWDLTAVWIVAVLSAPVGLLIFLASRRAR